MTLYTWLMIVFPALWTIIEIGLMLKDRAQHKGTTIEDKGTRNYNFLSLVLGLGLAAAFNGMPMFFFTGERTPTLFYVGVTIMLLGMVLRYWAVAVLGAYFRTTIETDKNQKVIQRGPYRLIRHPAYSGWLLMCLGYGIALQNWLSLLAAFLFPLAALLYRIHVEEPVLVAALGTEYCEYQKRTKKIIPWLW